jgi:hypothetical protein
LIPVCAYSSSAFAMTSSRKPSISEPSDHGAGGTRRDTTMQVEDAAMPKPIQINSDLYARAAAGAAREGKEVGAFINELIRMQIREAEKAHELARAHDEIAIQLEDETSDSGKTR